MKRLICRGALAMVFAACAATPAPAVANSTDPFGDLFGLYAPTVTPPVTAATVDVSGVCLGQTAQTVQAILQIPYSASQPPHYTQGLAFAGYFGVPFAVSPPFTLPDSGWTLSTDQPVLGGAMPIAVSTTAPWGIYEVAFLLWNPSSGSVGLLGGTLTVSPDFLCVPIPFPARDQSATPSASPSPAFRSALATRPPRQVIIARLRAAGHKTVSRFFRLPRVMSRATRSTVPVKVLRAETLLRARVASLWRR